MKEIKKRNKKGRFSNKAISIFMSLLIIFIPLTISALQPRIENGEIKNGVDNLINILEKLVSFIDIVPNVAAEDPVYGCCETTLLGFCQYTTEAQCLGGWHANEDCSNICQGCCIDTTVGKCYKNSFQNSCSGTGSIFLLGDILCAQMEMCKEGCCTIGYEKLWTTQQDCGNYNGAWDNTLEYYECFMAGGEDRGCCTYNCKYETVEECASPLGLTPSEARALGYFVERKCKESVTGCEQCQEDGAPKCVSGMPDLYKTDSCGNIYVDEIAETCASDEWCDPSAEDCVDATCVNVVDNWDGNSFDALPDRHGKDRVSGESWCVYDVPWLTAQNGTEPAGSVHQLRSCVNGKEIIDKVDYRTQICGEILIDRQGNEETNRDKRYPGDNYRSKAFWIGNNWRVCYLLDSQEDCDSNPTCFWISGLASAGEYNPDEEDWFGIREDSLNALDLSELGGDFVGTTTHIPPRCLPKYPPAYDEGQDNFPNPKMLCNLGTVECVLKDRLLGDENPECDDDDWLEKMTHRCRAIGDCGAYVNFLYTEKDTFTQEGILVAEVTSETDITGEITEKDIKRKWDVFYDLTNYGDFIEGLDAPSESGPFLAATASLIIIALLFIDISVNWVVGSFLGEVVVGLTNILPFSIGGIGTLQLINPFTLVGVLMLFIAHSLPEGPARATLETGGWALIVGGAASGIPAIASLAGPIGAIAGIVYAIFFAVWDVDHIVVKCMPWVPPSGAVSGEDCETECEKLDAQGNVIRPCTKYRCESISLACEYEDKINVGGQEYTIADAQCVKTEDDGLEPKIETVSAKNIVSNTNLNVDYDPWFPPADITISNQLSQLSQIVITFELDEKALCFYDIEHTDSINDMTFSMGFSKVQSFMPPVNPYNPNVYIRCSDAYENANVGEYIVKFSNVVQQDISAPVVSRIDPADGWKFVNTMDKVNIIVYGYDVHMPFFCTYAKHDGTYEQMKTESNAECTSEWIGSSTGCKFLDVPLDSQVTNIFYFKCKDSATNPGPNIMTNSMIVDYFPSPTLEIISIEPPTGSAIEGCPGEIPTTIEIVVETSGGADNGVATCYWSEESYSSGMVKFTETDSTTHRTEINTASSKVYIKCYDSALIVAQGEVSYQIEEDETSPIITRIYKDGDLILRTNEDAICAYNYRAQSCSFSVDDSLRAKKFYGEEKEHSTEWRSQEWYVKCQDLCGNGGTNLDPCIIVYPQELE